MLVNYMQLLGLLRLVRINWAAQLRQLLVYLDFTSGASTWISLECSLSDDDGSSSLPRSVRRSIVVLLWPRKLWRGWREVCGGGVARVGASNIGAAASGLELRHTLQHIDPR